MKISEKSKLCQLSPMRKFHSLAVNAKKSGVKVYHLNIGQPDLPTPEVFFQTVQAFRDKTLEYAPSPGIPELIDAIREYYKKLGVNYDADDIYITTGGSEALLYTCLSILDPGDEVIVPEPFYPNYSTFINSAGGVIRALPTTPKEGYRYAHRERIEKLINQNTRAIMITNPGNPTGVVLTAEEMRLIADIAKEHDLYIICDEVYREFCYDDSGKIPCMGRFADVTENLIIIDSVSKRFSSCGARIGCAITKNKELQNALMKFCQSRLSVATLDQLGAAALYGVDESYIRASIREYRHRRDICVAGLRSIPGVMVEEPMGAFYLMAKLPVDDTDKFQNWLLSDFEDSKETVMFAPGAPFYATVGSGITEVRIAYVLEEKELKRAVELLKIGIARYRKEVMGE